MLGQHVASDMSRAAAQGLGKALRAATNNGLGQQYILPQSAVSQQFIRFVGILSLIPITFVVLDSADDLSSA